MFESKQKTEHLPNWKEQLAAHFDGIDITFGEEATQARTNAVKDDLTLKERTQEAEVLFRYIRRFAQKEVDVEEGPGGTFSITFENTSEDIAKLPEEYGYKGGIARYALEKQLGMFATMPRDLDIVFCGTEEDAELSKKLAKQYMPDDFLHGHGVETLGDDYFDTRDFTINEVILAGSKITATRQCLLDTIRRVIRVTEYEKKERNYEEGDYWVNPKLLAKALRFLAQEKVRVSDMSFADEDAVQWIGIDSFHMALHLDRAIECSEDIADQYVQELVARDQLPDWIHTAREAREYLSEDLYSFLFRTSLPNEREAYAEIIDTVDKELQQAPFRESFSKGYK